MSKGPRDAVIRLGNVFCLICTRVVNPAEIPNMKLYVTETLCLLEMWFPPSFFDIMTHLVLHLVEELDICGHVHARWMYGVERYLGVLKGFVWNWARPEACIATGYAFEESLGFITYYLRQYNPMQRPIWESEQDEMDVGEVL
jgi:hypothetical protein